MSVERFNELTQAFAEAAGDMAEIYAKRNPSVTLLEAYLGRLSSGSKQVLDGREDSLFPDEGVLDSQGNGVIHYAAEGVNPNLVKRLAETRPELLEQKNALGRTPLHTAVWAEKVESVKALAKTEALVNAQDNDGTTPLALSVAVENEEVFNALIKAKANPNIADNDGMTPLHFAAALGLSAFAQKLLDKGADPNALDKRKRSPMHYACMNQDEAIADALGKAGASEYDPDASGKTAEQYRSMAIEGDRKAESLAANAKGLAAKKISVG